MSNTSKKPRESMLITADMPTDYIATNGYEYVLKSKYQSLKEQAEKLLEALESYSKLENFGKTVWENDERDGRCWYEELELLNCARVIMQEHTLP